MYFADRQNPPETTLAGNPDTHLLDVLNPDTWTDKSVTMLRTAFNLDSKITGPESTQVLRTLYNKQFYATTDDPAEVIYGTVMYRDQEVTDNFSYYKHVMRDYVNNNIKKTVNISLREYMELTSYEKFMVDEFAQECSKVIAKEVERMEKDNDINIKRNIANLDMDDDLY